MLEDRTKLRREQLYPVCDRPTFEDLCRLGLKRNETAGPLVSLGLPATQMHARWTGEKRPPKKGEWYLSGAEIGAYRASNDLSTAYHIAELLRTKTEVKTIITIIPNGQQKTVR